jgi:hypothetical protein
VRSQPFAPNPKAKALIGAGLSQGEFRRKKIKRAWQARRSIGFIAAHPNADQLLESCAMAIGHAWHNQFKVAVKTDKNAILLFRGHDLLI